jgi:DNA topoisomerase-1
LGGEVARVEATLVRAGTPEYARTNESYGLTALKNRHVEVEGPALKFKFKFKGKSGKVWKFDVRDQRVAKVVRALQTLPGQSSFDTWMRTARRAT